MSGFLKVILNLSAGLLLFQLAGCAKKCIDSSSTCGTFQTCCSAGSCYYKYNNKTYDCNGTDCNDAAQRLAADMCGAAKRQANEILSTTEKKALEQARILIENAGQCGACP